MADKARIFFGFELPRAVSRQATGLRTLVDDPRSAVRWIKGVNIHLTVRFLGLTPRDAIDDIASATGTALEKNGPISIQVQGTGVFPDARRPRVLWMGITGEVERLTLLEGAIHKAVEPLGFPRDDRAYVPHVTLGRIRYPQKVPPKVDMFLHSRYDPVDCSLEVLHLYESQMGAAGIIYTPLISFPLSTHDQESP